MKTILAQSKFYEQGKNNAGVEFRLKMQIIELIGKEIIKKYLILNLLMHEKWWMTKAKKILFILLLILN